MRVADIETEYYKQHPVRDKKRGAEGEGEDIHFERWLQYAKQHTNDDGYLVPYTKVYEELSKLRERQKLTGAIPYTTINAKWTPMGPSTIDKSDANHGIGRILVAAFHPTDSNTYWVGTFGGGVWVTHNNAVSWTPLMDSLPSLIISGIAVNPFNPKTIYVSTGKQNGFGHFGSVGVLKTTDGGQTWQLLNTGLNFKNSEPESANCIVLNPLDSNSLLLATSKGIYQSHNGGNSWSRTSEHVRNFIQVLYHPTDTNIVYATNCVNDSNNVAHIVKSKDGGGHWKQVDTFTRGTLNITLAVTKQAPLLVEAIIAQSTGLNNKGLYGIYQSKDAGENFHCTYAGGCTTNINLIGHQVTLGQGDTILNGQCGGQGGINLTITIDPFDSKRIYVGGINTWYSMDGGYTWNLVSQWQNYITGYPVVHADKHFMGFQPTNPHKFFECNDGGIFTAYNPGSHSLWKFIGNTMDISTFYSIAVSAKPFYQIGGRQDDGSIFQDKKDVSEILGGDGSTSVIDQVDAKVFYAVNNGGIFRYGLSAKNKPCCSVNILKELINDSASSSPPLIIAPNNHNQVILGLTKIWKSLNRGDSFTCVSTNFGSKTQFKKIAMSGQDLKTLYAFKGSTQIYYSDNLETNESKITWDSISNTYGTLSDIKVDPKNKTHIWVCFSGYGKTKVGEFFRQSNPAKWTDLTASGLPDIPLNSIVVDSTNNDMYVGTDLGVYYRSSDMTAWEYYGSGLPTVIVTELQIDYVNREIWAGTFGRSMWKAPLQ